MQQISKTTKFIIVRHPFERLLSAYRDKLEHMKGREYYYRRYGQYITHRYRAKQSNLTSREPSFTEFLQFIAKEKRFDEHWVPFIDSCQPCSMNYDYIFKFESLIGEYNYFIREHNLQYYLNYSRSERISTNFQGITDDAVAEKYFEQVPVALLLSIFNIYQLDFLLFSYSPAKYYFMTRDANQERYSFLLKT